MNVMISGVEIDIKKCRAMQARMSLVSLVDAPVPTQRTHFALLFRRTKLLSRTFNFEFCVQLHVYQLAVTHVFYAI